MSKETILLSYLETLRKYSWVQEHMQENISLGTWKIAANIYETQIR